ncbi:hypothetical protein AVEN_43739-1 [Araneus ventricosus]|uniref:SWIM-type domain-containing protein n=1 Tax=Araneus ventricosus TaxID=182803 RepID=A0A4Y2BXY4_ARAVE|nr:hypothetical protein AVEN_43739-1 [Araneus ventricosus]
MLQNSRPDSSRSLSCTWTCKCFGFKCAHVVVHVVRRETYRKYFNKLTHERDVDLGRNTEGGRRTFKAPKTRGSECEKVVVTKKLKIDSCYKTKKPELLPFMMSAQTFKENIIQSSVCDKIYVDPPSEDWIKCWKCSTLWYEGC